MAADRSKRKAASCSLARPNFRAGLCFVAALTDSRRQRAIKHFHYARRQVRKQSVGGDNQIRRQRHDERGLTAPARAQYLARSALHGNGSEWNFARPIEPSVLGSVISLELRVNLRTGPHQSRRDGRYIDIVLGEFGTDCIGKTGEREFTGRVRRHMRDSKPSADGRNVYDSPAAFCAH